MRRALRPLDALFPRTRQRVLAVLLLEPERWWYRADLAKRLGTTPSSLQRELATLIRAHLLDVRQDGNRVYFRANRENPLFPDLRSLLEKSVGLADVLRASLSRQRGRVQAAFVYGSIASGTERASSDVDLMVIGDVTLKELGPSLRHAESRLHRPINVSLYSLRELATKAGQANHFVRKVLGGPKLFVIGTEHDLESALR